MAGVAQYNVHFTGELIQVPEGLAWAVDGLGVTLIGKTAEELEKQLDETLNALRAYATSTPDCDYLELLRSRGIELTPSSQHTVRRLVNV